MALRPTQAHVRDIVSTFTDTTGIKKPEDKTASFPKAPKSGASKRKAAPKGPPKAAAKPKRQAAKAAAKVEPKPKRQRVRG